MGAYNIVNQPALQSGQPEDISVVLANLQAIQAVLNGGIDNSNINVAAAILASKLSGYPADITKALRGDGSWGTLTAVSAALNVGAANTDLAAPAGSDNYWVATTAGGTLRSIGAGAAGARITLKNGTAAGYIRLLHATAGGAGAQLSIINAGHKFLAPGQSIEFRYDGAVWQEVNRPSQELICDLVLGGVQASFDTDTILGIAASLPQVYSQLKLEVMLRSDGAGSSVNNLLRLNNDAGGNYDTQYLQMTNNGASITGSSGISQTSFGHILSIAATATTANAFTPTVIDIPDYSSGAVKKHILGLTSYNADRSALNSGIRTITGFWDNVAAITRLSLIAGSASNFIAGSRFSLYGIT